MNLRNQLKLYLEYNNINATVLAKKSKVPRSTIQDWLTTDSGSKDLEKLKKVADVLATTVDDLCFGNGIRTESSFREYESEINAGLFEVVLRKVKK